MCRRHELPEEPGSDLTSSGSRFACAHANPRGGICPTGASDLSWNVAGAIAAAKKDGTWIDWLELGPLTMSELLEGCASTMTVEEYNNERAAIISAAYVAGYARDTFVHIVRTHAYQHDGGTIDQLADRWIENEAWSSVLFPNGRPS